MVDLTRQQAIDALRPWRFCFVSQVWDVPAFPRVAVLGLGVGFDFKRHQYTGIDALIRLAEKLDPAAKNVA